VRGRKSPEDSRIGYWIQKTLEKHPAFLANPLGDWIDIVGEQVARYAQPVSLKEKVLTVVAYDSVWKHHLEVCKESLLVKINRGRPLPLVEKILIRVGEVPEPQAVLNRNHHLLKKFKGRGPGSRQGKSLLSVLSPPRKRSSSSSFPTTTFAGWEPKSSEGFLWNPSELFLSQVEFHD